MELSRHLQQQKWTSHMTLNSNHHSQIYTQGFSTQPFSTSLPSREPTMSLGILETFDLRQIKDNDDIQKLEVVAKQVMNRSLDPTWFQKESPENRSKIIVALQMTLVYNDYSQRCRSENLQALHQAIDKEERLIRMKKREVGSLKERCYQIKEQEAIKRESVKEYKRYLQSLHKCVKCNKYVKNITGHKLHHHTEEQKGLGAEQAADQIRQLTKIEELFAIERENKNTLAKLLEQNSLIQKQLLDQQKEIQRKPQPKLGEQATRDIKKLTTDLKQMKGKLQDIQSQVMKFPEVEGIIEEQLKPIYKKIEEGNNALNQTLMNNTLKTASNPYVFQRQTSQVKVPVANQIQQEPSLQPTKRQPQEQLSKANNIPNHSTQQKGTKGIPEADRSKNYHKNQLMEPVPQKVLTEPITSIQRSRSNHQHQTAAIDNVTEAKHVTNNQPKVAERVVINNSKEVLSKQESSSKLLNSAQCFNIPVAQTINKSGYPNTQIQENDYQYSDEGFDDQQADPDTVQELQQPRKDSAQVIESLLQPLANTQSLELDTAMQTLKKFQKEKLSSEVENQPVKAQQDPNEHLINVLKPPVKLSKSFDKISRNLSQIYGEPTQRNSNQLDEFGLKKQEQANSINVTDTLPKSVITQNKDSKIDKFFKTTLIQMIGVDGGHDQYRVPYGTSVLPNSEKLQNKVVGQSDQQGQFMKLIREQYQKVFSLNYDDLNQDTLESIEGKIQQMEYILNSQNAEIDRLNKAAIADKQGLLMNSIQKVSSNLKGFSNKPPIAPVQGLSIPKKEIKQYADDSFDRISEDYLKGLTNQKNQNELSQDF